MSLKQHIVDDFYEKLSARKRRLGGLALFITSIVGIALSVYSLALNVGVIYASTPYTVIIQGYNSTSTVGETASIPAPIFLLVISSGNLILIPLAMILLGITGWLGYEGARYKTETKK